MAHKNSPCRRGCCGRWRGFSLELFSGSRNIHNHCTNCMGSRIPVGPHKRKQRKWGNVHIFMRISNTEKKKKVENLPRGFATSARGLPRSSFLCFPPTNKDNPENMQESNVKHHQSKPQISGCFIFLFSFFYWILHLVHGYGWFGLFFLTNSPIFLHRWSEVAHTTGLVQF